MTDPKIKPRATRAVLSAEELEAGRKAKAADARVLASDPMPEPAGGAAKDEAKERRVPRAAKADTA